MGKKNSIRYSIPIIHIVLSFFYERSILDFTTDSSVVLGIPMGGVSYKFESVLTYSLAKLIAVLAIYYIWKLIFYLFDEGFKLKHIRAFAAFFAIGLVFCVFCFPEMFLYSEDNLVTYSYAVKLFPEYWHSCYSSIVYTACLMVAPFQISINILQWLGFVASLGYLYHRLSNLTYVSIAKRWMIFILLLVPDIFFMVGNAYRTEQYAILCMFYMSLVVMDIVEKKERPVHELISLAILSAFIGVWRSEGAILGILGYFSLLLFVYKLGAVKRALLAVFVVICFVVIGIPQKLGNTKFYGSDYSFINSFPSLHNILCAESRNLSYEGASEDLEAISKVVPIDMVASYGMEGYRRYNYYSGRPDINQSMAGEEISKAYKKAYYRMVLHNPVIYAKTQLSFLLQAIKLKNYAYIETNHIVPIEKDYPNYEYASWDIGRKLYFDGIQGWYDNSFRKSISEKALAVLNAYRDFASKTFAFSALLIVSVLFEIYIFFKEFILFCKKKTDRLGFAAFSFILLGQAAAITLVMPAGVLAYFHAYFYCTFILDLVYIIINLGKVKKTHDYITYTDNLE